MRNDTGFESTEAELPVYSMERVAKTGGLGMSSMFLWIGTYV